MLRYVYDKQHHLEEIAVKKKIETELQMKQYTLKQRQAKAQEMVENFKEFVAKANSYEIATFCPGKIKDIQVEFDKIRQLDETVRMLNYILN